MKNKKINRNVNKIMTLTMAGAVALSTPLSLVYAAPDANEQHEYTDIHGVCDICGESKENGNHFIDEVIEDDEIIIEDTETIVDDETSESTETESTETTEEPEEKNLKDFTFYIKGAKTATDEDLKNIYNKLKTDGKYSIGYGGGNTEKNLGVKVNIYNKSDNLIDTLTIYNNEEIIKSLPEKDSGGYMQYHCKPELVAENLHYTKNGDCFMYSSIKTADGEIPVLKFFIFNMCWNHSNYEKSEEPIHIMNECIMVCNYNDPDFDLDEFLQDEEIYEFFYREIITDKGCVCTSRKPPLPPTSETTEEPSTETTEEPSTEITEEPSTETTEEPSTETTEEPSTETTEEPSTETTEEPSTETTEEPSTETTEEPSTETTEEPSTETTEEPSTETTEEPSTETTEEPSTETTEEPSTETTEEPSTETTEEPSTETTEEPSTETTEENETPEPVKPIEPDKTEETITPITPTPEPITEDRGKVDPSETTTNEIVKTGDMASNTYYGGYFLATAFGVLTAFFKKFKK